MSNLPDHLVRYRRHDKAVGVSQLENGIAEMQVIRRAHLASLGLDADAASLLGGLLELNPMPTLFGGADGLQLLRSLDSKFDSLLSPSVQERRDNISLRLMVRLPPLQKLRLLAGDLRTARIYLSKKKELLAAPLRQRREQRARQYLAQAICRSIRRNGGHCEKDLRIYGDGTGAKRVQFGAFAAIEHSCSLWLSSADTEQCGHLRTGDNLFLGFNCRINVYADVTIGNRVLIGANSYLASNNHNYRDPSRPIQSQGFTGAPIVIGDDVWLGCNVVVLPGVTIGPGAIVGAGSVVTHDVPAMEIWGGVPSRKLKSRPGIGT